MSPKKRTPSSAPETPKVALCYIRQSYTRNGNDLISPERQRDNILAMCQKNNWIAEFFEDDDGHKSGREVRNRPGWLALNNRLGDDDVGALVANNLARLHRKHWRVGDLIEYLQSHSVELVLAAPSREIDTSAPVGVT
jgi:DNA invertase Pin-like site-specific DNA recombinase